MKYFDFKVTIWDRVTVPEEHEEAVSKAIQSGEINSVQDVFNFLDGSGEYPEHEFLYDTDQQVTLEDNAGFSTIEILDKDNAIWQNGTSI